MKSTILTIVLFFVTYTYSQDVAISQKFFTTTNMRLSVDLGADMSWAGKNGKTGLMSQIGNIDEDLISYDKNPNTTINIGFDIYSPNSTLGFYIGTSFNNQKYTIKNNINQVRDSITSRNTEIPFYLKLRFGKVNRKGHFWLALGGGYSFPSKTERITHQNNVILSENDDSDIFQSTPFLSSIIGYEYIIPSGSNEKTMYNRDNFRVLLYAKANYDLGNRIDPDFEFLPNTSLIHLENPEIKFLRISFGIKILMRISKVKDVVKESVKYIKTK
jgi:hypothetical protein